MFHGASTLFIIVKLLCVRSLARTGQAPRNYTLPIINFQHVAVRMCVVRTRRKFLLRKYATAVRGLIKLGTLTETINFLLTREPSRLRMLDSALPDRRDESNGLILLPGISGISHIERALNKLSIESLMSFPGA